MSSSDFNPFVAAIPAVAPKVAYEPPVFKTFQERKRENEMARRILAESSMPNTPTDSPSISTPPASFRPVPMGTPPVLQDVKDMFSSPQVSEMPVPSINGPPPRRTATPTSTPTRGSSSRPLPTPTSPPPLPSSDNFGNGAGPSSFVATIERSDTISSIRSLDRVGFSPRRPLPQPPVGVVTSRSLDRGSPSRPQRHSRINGYAIRGTSPVEEEGEMSDSGISVTPTKRPMETPNDTPSKMILPTIVISTEVVPGTPPVPIIVLPAGDSPESIERAAVPSINVPSIAISPTPEDALGTPNPTRDSQVTFTTPPMIRVSSEDADEAVALSIGTSSPVSLATAHIPRIETTKAIICAGCRELIVGRVVNAMQKRFHPRCFKCDQCGDLLEHVSSFEWDGKAYCHLDYHDVRTLWITRRSMG